VAAARRREHHASGAKTGNADSRLVAGWLMRTDDREANPPAPEPRLPST